MTKLPDTEQYLANLLQLIELAGRANEPDALARQVVASVAQHFGAVGAGIWLQTAPQPACLHAQNLDARALQPQVEQSIAAGTPLFAELSQAGGAVALTILPLIVEQSVQGALLMITAAPLSGASRLGAQTLAAYLGARLQGLQARRLAEQRQLELVASNDGWNEFIGHAAHEIKNPLASVKGYADLLLRRTTDAPTDQFRKGLTIIAQQSSRATDLLSNMSDTSRIDSDRVPIKPEPVDLSEFVRQATEAHGEAPNPIELTADEPIPAHFDRARMRQALDAVLDNAAKFSPAGAPIELRVERSGGPPASQALIVVTDHGVGIPPAEQREVFDRFKRGSNVRGLYRGLGIGLFMARTIVERHGGRIWLESQPGQGTTCYIALPLDS